VVDSWNILSLCTGGGGLDRAVGLVVETARTVCVVEREAFALEVLASEAEALGVAMPPVWTDLTTFDGRPWRGVVDCLIAGIPCQPHSVAGKRLGAADERNLWPAAERIIREVEPPWVFLENVGGSIAFFAEYIIPGLEAMGYRPKSGLFEAAEVGAPHRRQRLFVLAYSGEGDDGRRGQGCYLDAGRETEAVGQEGPDGVDDLRETLADAKGDGCQRGTCQPSCSSGRSSAPGQPHHANESGTSAGTSGWAVADAECAEPGAGEPGVESQATGRGRHRPADRGADVVNTTSKRPNRRGANGGNESAGVSGSGPGAALQPWPPGPADIDAWRRVLEIECDLAPALPSDRVGILAAARRTYRLFAPGRNRRERGKASREAFEPAIRGVVDGLAARADRLRLLGNGVVEAQGAYAFITLLARLGIK